jgi:hypothetical protein
LQVRFGYGVTAAGLETGPDDVREDCRRPTAVVTPVQDIGVGGAVSRGTGTSGASDVFRCRARAQGVPAVPN